ncbi:hypothetical protein FHY55_13155 [Oceanicola sp. D3]|uniref:hypothetical protein n=1 Tax=Oceanicola sp. D3 TaxID=2587163 RepID=UPI001121BCEF|nr:hypothetical protein [Oceanicola sp. D3]QDC10137.1 hypothetical protein FHY55_13155 [Oceanicola sp. D3]
MGTQFSPRYGFRAGGGTDEIIRETCGGWNAGRLVYPGVSSCTTITFRDGAGNLAGLHLAMSDTLIMAGRLIELVRPHLAGGVTAVIHVGRMSDTLGGWNTQPGYDWPAQAVTVRGLVNAPAVPTYYVDTPHGGYDVQVEPAVGAGFDVALKPQSGHPPDFTNGWMPVPVNLLP